MPYVDRIQINAAKMQMKCIQCVKIMKDSTSIFYKLYAH